MFEHAVDHRIGQTPAIIVDIDDPLPHHQATGDGDGADIIADPAIDEDAREEPIRVAWPPQRRPGVLGRYADRLFPMDRGHQPAAVMQTASILLPSGSRRKAV
nr:hypothetical protein [Plastoroseomonas hellenica]